MSDVEVLRRVGAGGIGGIETEALRNLERGALCEVALGVLGALPEDEWWLFFLREGQRLPFAAIARRFGVRTKTVSRRYNRLLRRIRAAVASALEAPAGFPKKTSQDRVAFGQLGGSCTYGERRADVGPAPR